MLIPPPPMIMVFQAAGQVSSCGGGVARQIAQRRWQQLVLHFDCPAQGVGAGKFALRPPSQFGEGGPILSAPGAEVRCRKRRRSPPGVRPARTGKACIEPDSALCCDRRQFGEFRRRGSSKINAGSSGSPYARAMVARQTDWSRETSKSGSATC